MGEFSELGLGLGSLMLRILKILCMLIQTRVILSESGFSGLENFQNWDWVWEV